jgi:hypothetical protein
MLVLAQYLHIYPTSSHSCTYLYGLIALFYISVLSRTAQILVWVQPTSNNVYASITGL